MANKNTERIDFVFRDFIKTDRERRFIDTAYQIHELKKGEIFLQDGDPWYKFGIIIKGSIYSYFFNEKGEKNVTGFYYFPQNYIVVDYETFASETKVSMSYECYEDSIILLFDGIKLNALFNVIPGLHEKRRKLAEDRYFKALNVIKLLQTTNADEKVQELYNQTPELFKLFPYSYISSYLGMHRNTYRKAFRSLKI